MENVVVLGYRAAMVFSGVETAVVVGGMSAIGSAIFGLGIPKDSVNPNFDKQTR